MELWRGSGWKDELLNCAVSGRLTMLSPQQSAIALLSTARRTSQGLRFISRGLFQGRGMIATASSAAVELDARVQRQVSMARNRVPKFSTSSGMFLEARRPERLFLLCPSFLSLLSSHSL